MRFLLFVVLIPFGSLAQEFINMGTWRTHYSYTQCQTIESVGNKVFASFPNGILYYDTEDSTTHSLSKNDGLNGEVITAMAFDELTMRLVLGYADGNIDYIEGSEIINLPILFDKDIADNKSVNHISFYQGRANLSTDFGLLVLDIEAEAIRDSYLNLGTGGEEIVINQSLINENELYLATSQGILKGILNNGDVLQDFNNWERALSDEVILSVTSYDGRLFAAGSERLFELQGAWVEMELGLDDESEISRIRGTQNGLLVLTSDHVYILDEDLNSRMEVSVEQASDAWVDPSGVIWIADNELGLTSYFDSKAERYTLDSSPMTDSHGRMEFIEDKMIVFPILSLNSEENDLTNELGYSTFDVGSWLQSTPDQNGGLSNISGVLYQNDGSRYISSFGGGFFDEGSMTLYDQTNSPLQPDVNGNVLVSGVDFDSHGNTWMVNHSSLPLIKFTQEGSFETFSWGLSRDEPSSILIDPYDQIWLRMGVDGQDGLLVFDIESGVDRYFSSGNSDLASSQIHDIALSDNNEIWLATESGVAYFPNIFNMTDNLSNAPVIPTFQGRNLFEDQAVYAVAIDGGNRKWVGTSDGVWLFDENISEILLNFNTRNSPLPSDVVNDIEINAQTGEVFFSTGLGIISYRSDATLSSGSHTSVEIYPNPVPPQYEGLVGFRGLAPNVTLKITTVSGKLVREIQANGGAASWDVRDYKGGSLFTGVYLVFSATADGSETFVGKLAIIN